MKNSVLILCLVSTALIGGLAVEKTASATGFLFYGDPCSYYGYWRTCPLDPVRACAPEVKEGNLQAVDRILNELAVKPDFADAEKFRSELSRVQALEPNKRIVEYLKEVGIDPTNNTEIVEFIGARGAPQAKYVDALKANTGLTDEQASIVIRTLTENLLGGVR